MSATTDPTGWIPTVWKTIQDAIKSETDRSPIRKILDVSSVPNAHIISNNLVKIIKDTFTVTEDLIPWSNYIPQLRSRQCLTNLFFRLYFDRECGCLLVS